MGKAAEFLTKEAGSPIPSVERIACVTSTSFLIPCSVSNWGGYALAAALGTPLDNKDSNGNGGTSRDLLGTPELETAICESMISAGARDGVTVGE